MDKLEKVLKQYDKLLNYKKNLDGSVDIFRNSPFSASVKHRILTVSNRRIGSAKWVIKKLISMDTTRRDLVGDAMRHNWKIRDSKSPRNMHEDMADFMASGGDSFIN